MAYWLAVPMIVWNLYTDKSQMDLLTVKLPWSALDAVLMCSIYAVLEYLIRTLFSRQNEAEGPKQ